MTASRHLVQLLKMLNKVTDDDKDMHFIGPFFDMHPYTSEPYNQRQLENIKPLVSMDDWIWDTCGIGRFGEAGVYDYKRRLCDDKDNPLYYYQTEILVDGFDSIHDAYYPAITAEEAAMHSSEPRSGPYFGMVEWNQSSDIFWQRWVKQEMKSNMDLELIDTGLLKTGVRKDYDPSNFTMQRIANAMIRWSRNIDGASTFAQDLIWYRNRQVNGRVKPGESFYIAYISLHEHITIRSVVFAVGVFIQEGGFYSTMGITKSFRVSMSDTHKAKAWMAESDEKMRSETEHVAVIQPAEWISMYNAVKCVSGYSIKLQVFIRDEVKRLNFKTIGLLFRPNGIMRSIMRNHFRSHLLGSNVDWDHSHQLLELGRGDKSNQSIMDNPPSILQYADFIKIAGTSVPSPFWESKTTYRHPDSPLNPHLPLMFISMDDFDPDERT